MLLLFLLSRPGIAAPAAAPAGPDPLQKLAELFRTDPVAGFEQAVRAFEGPARSGDLAGMLAILRIVGPEAVRCRYTRPLDDMADAVGEAAAAAGKWEALGEIQLLRARGDGGQVQLANWVLGSVGSYLPRALYFGEQAVASFRKAGLERPDTPVPLARESCAGGPGLRGAECVSCAHATPLRAPEFGPAVSGPHPSGPGRCRHRGGPWPSA